MDPASMIDWMVVMDAAVLRSTSKALLCIADRLARIVGKCCRAIQRRHIFERSCRNVDTGTTNGIYLLSLFSDTYEFRELARGLLCSYPFLRVPNRLTIRQPLAGVVVCK